MSSRASCTTPPRTRTCSAPSPSTRVSSRTSILRLTLCVMELSLLPEGRRVGVEGAEDAGHVRFAHPALAQRLGDRGGVGGGDRAEAAVTAPVVRRAQRAAAGCGDRTQTGGAVRDDGADVVAQLALRAHRGGGRPPCSSAASSSSSCTRLIGQPRSSWSTRTCWAIGVDRSSVATYSGWGYTIERYSSTSATLRSACPPPEAAHAPIVP